MASEEAELWRRWVPGMGPEQFMDRAHHWAMLEGAWWTTARKAARDYMTRIISIYGPDNPRVPEDLEEALVQHIVEELGVDEDAPWRVVA